MMNCNIIYPKQLIVDFIKGINSHKWVFILLPLLVALVFQYVIKDNNRKNVIELINSALTSFVPIFATILSVYISWVFQKRTTMHERDRLQMFEETTGGIFMLIPLVLVSMWMNFMYHMDLSFILPSFIYKIYRETTFSLLIFSFSEIMLVILMITKRSYVIIMNELKLLEETKENSKY